VPYLTEVKGFTNEQVMNDIFPMYTYATFAFTVLAAPASQARCAACCVLALRAGAACV
jgi:hypothetical protein